MFVPLVAVLGYVALVMGVNFNVRGGSEAAGPAQHEVTSFWLPSHARPTSMLLAIGGARIAVRMANFS